MTELDTSLGIIKGKSGFVIFFFVTTMHDATLLQGFESSRQSDVVIFYVLFV